LLTIACEERKDDMVEYCSVAISGCSCRGLLDVQNRWICGSFLLLVLEERKAKLQDPSFLTSRLNFRRLKEQSEQSLCL